jgi:tRNA threonylcarbamoyl adenosine modification protein (Sua5/YciO/YrdC/YwlC family)
MPIKIYPVNPNEKQIARVVRCLEEGGVVIYPTDSVYGFGCSLRSPRGVERLSAITGKQPGTLALVCEDLSRVARYAKVDDQTFKLLKRHLPGPFTFILDPSSRVPDKALGKRKSIGVRIPSNPIAQAIVAALGCPMLTTSVKDPDSEAEYTTDPELIEERYGNMVQMVVDGGYGDNRHTTLVDLTGEQPVIVRQGKGELL